MSELLKWFEKRREERVLTLMQDHLATTMTIVEDLEKAVKAAANDDEKEMKLCIDRVTSAERQADRLRREVMDELSRGELPPIDREDLMHLMKRVDMVADMSRESTRILNAIPIKKVPESLKKACIEMVEGARECASALRKCVSKISERPEDALKAVDVVERQEEKVDDLYENSKLLIAKETTMNVGVAILTSQLLDTIEMVADWCEDACDQVRIIIVRR